MADDKRTGRKPAAVAADRGSRVPCISKSKFMQGRQCPKLLWSAYNAKHLFPEVGAGPQVEVKSTTGLKEVHIPDVAFQTWVFTEAGIKIRRCFLCHINNEFVRQGKIDPKEFFTLRDVTAEVAQISRDLEEQVGQMGKVIRAAKCPEIQIGKQCDNPYPCPLHDHCWSFLPERNVLELYHDTKARGHDLLKRGVLRIADIPEDYALSEKQGIQRATAISGKPHVKRTQLETFLNGLEYPLQFLDFAKRSGSGCGAHSTSIADRTRREWFGFWMLCGRQTLEVVTGCRRTA